MPGKRITDLQVTKYKTLRGEHSQEASAAKTGISAASARRVEAATVLDDGVRDGDVMIHTLFGGARDLTDIYAAAAEVVEVAVGDGGV